MYIDPQYAIKEGWLRFPEWMDEETKQKCIQPNAIDITLDRVFDLNPISNFVLSEDHKVMRKTNELSATQVVPDRDRNELYFAIPHGHVDILSDFYVEVPAGVAAFLIVRSTLNRNGLFVTSGLYDQGFKNNIGFMLRNQGPVAYIAPHTRVAQLVFVKSEDSGIMYNGTYNQNQGEHWSAIQQTAPSQQPDYSLPENEIVVEPSGVSDDGEWSKYIGIQKMVAPTGITFDMSLPNIDNQNDDSFKVVDEEPERKVFTIDVGDVSPEEVKVQVQNAIKEIKTTKQKKLKGE